MKPESLYYQNQTKLLEESKTTDFSHQQRYKTQHEQRASNNVNIYIYTMITWVYCSMQASFSSLKSINITQMSIVRWVDKQNVVRPYSGLLLSLQSKEILQYATTWMSSADIRPITDGRILCDFTYMSQSHREAGWWLLTLGEGRRVSLTGAESQISVSCRTAVWQLCRGVHGFHAAALKGDWLLW